jgi:hypothetical protein
MQSKSVMMIDDDDEAGKAKGEKNSLRTLMQAT